MQILYEINSSMYAIFLSTFIPSMHLPEDKAGRFGNVLDGAGELHPRPRLEHLLLPAGDLCVRLCNNNKMFKGTLKILISNLS